jgi:hypothetical protein
MMSANCFNQNIDSMNESEFPSLSEASTEKPRKSSGKKNVIKLVVPLKTYKDELDEKYRDLRPALENLKTRMCNSVDKDYVCPHGDQCRFAHSLDELVIRDCHFNNCRFVKLKSGKLVNDGSNICRNKHTHETKDDFIKRTGLAHYKTNPPNHEEIDVGDDLVVEEVKVKEVTHEVEVKVDEEVTHETTRKQSFACDRQTNYSCAAVNKSFLSQGSASVKFVCPVPFSDPQPVQEPLSPTFKFGPAQQPLDNEILLRVPKVLAIQALELAMNSGNRCIRLEVIE